jgi:hypothetical protein
VERKNGSCNIQWKTRKEKEYLCISEREIKSSGERFKLHKWKRKIHQLMEGKRKNYQVTQVVDEI